MFAYTQKLWKNRHMFRDIFVEKGPMFRDFLLKSNSKKQKQKQKQKTKKSISPYVLIWKYPPPPGWYVTFYHDLRVKSMLTLLVAKSKHVHKPTCILAVFRLKHMHKRKCERNHTKEPWDRIDVTVNFRYNERRNSVCYNVSALS